MILARSPRTSDRSLVGKRRAWHAPVVILSQEAGRATDKLSSIFDNTFHGTETFGPNYS